MLQWGHVLSDVETHAGTAPCRGFAHRCFNGATSCRTWKRSSVSRIIVSAPDLLQWGHVLSDVETRPTR